MVIDGKAIAESIKTELREEIERRGIRPRLALVVVGEDFATDKFVSAKKRFAERAGIEVLIANLPEDSSQTNVENAVRKYAEDESVSGIVVQLPLPEEINVKDVLNIIPPKKDVDALTENGEMLSPVVLAVKEILERESVEISNKKALVIGRGKLVGIPVSDWLKESGAETTVVDINTKDLDNLTKKADIIISGTGSPGLIKEDMISEEVVLIDAGTSEASGKLRGDAESDCASKCSIFTPVPGGVGPIVVATLLKNVVENS
ncbi:MAG: bifunctional 5,10-methylenetetrahydrofolate dehydrogenase/5,10-methenyltetrahydrofolate cyclohydrolase [Candidatus Pacebacteria bacterium]|jgi:methylenetetrahydrofolate dehydrogenase (NADP+)/methenyltetrahydrofolate cyclohydrolase|nr:hypothetical protein [bacterium]MDP6527387.1 bifunctional 5,10-methylenetetrahydrofolate dehydrogenase/5,10-methenyltetrahydrofolate cyclohydrolase [Candidatus Paceibacterota bacterium]MDP6659514.1 bifunctional 5,10-methylenetetrahydrofolate dehydrogenase/5,10-methenyltetrahydrofolate cyclohydrolase [Candidatus Paceibacterota bacterium]|tara:strand:- start:37958 stop:38743 length:786 start_codon:yes stop_codon:yes gene_type:complete